MPKVSKEKQSKAWIFTLNSNEHYNLEEKSVQEAFIKKLNAIKTTSWTFQLERGEETERLHFQGRMSFKNGCRKPELLKKLANWNKGDSLTLKVEYNEEGSSQYVVKEDTRVAGPWSKDKMVGSIPKDIKGITLRPWQQHIVDSASIDDFRCVDVVYDPVGNNGKSIVSRHIGVHKIGLDVPPLTDSKELMGFVMSFPKYPIYVFDMPRAMKKEKLHGLYSAIETIKGGKAYDTRYVGKMEYFDPPRVWVFTNVLPDTNLLSHDRWRFWSIKDHQLVPYSSQGGSLTERSEDSALGLPSAGQLQSRT